MVDLDDGSEPPYCVQAIASDEVLYGAETVYMCDTLDYWVGHSAGDQTLGSFPHPEDGGAEVSAGNWRTLHAGDSGTGSSGGSAGEMHLNRALILGARHLGKANVLFADGHVTNDGQEVRTKRGEMPIASTFSDFTTDRGLGNQHHIMPTGRRF
jgi:prepilin-type processing-associated H-X9-DG protein